jgi:hypothetical protein
MRGYLDKRFHPEIVKEREVEGLDQRIGGHHRGKDDLLGLLLGEQLRRNGEGEILSAAMGGIQNRDRDLS